MLKINLLVAFLVLLVTSFFSTSPVLAVMCGADNSGGCQIACDAGQSSIADSTNKCTGALTGAGGTVCCSPAKTKEWPASQCQALGGANAIGGNGCDDIANSYDAGVYLTLDCNASGRCCLPFGAPNVNPQACSAANCEGSVPGAACRSFCRGGETDSGAGVCPRAADKCCIPGGGGICQDKGGVCVAGTCASQNRNPNNGGSCVGADAGKTCCTSATISSGPIVGKLNYTLLEEIPGSSETRGDLGLYVQNLYKFTFWAIGVAALFMLTVGGFMYVTAAGNTSRMDTAKTIITDSILGIVVALFAWIFLYVLNPDLVEGLKLTNTVRTGVPSPTPAPTGPTAPSGDAKTLAQQILAGGTGITFSNSGSCSNASGTAVSPKFTLEQIAADSPVIRCKNGCPGAGACTDTTSINPRMLQAMIAVAKRYPFQITSMTGGSHCELGVTGCKGLSAHYSGKAVDISTGNKGDWPAIVNAFKAEFSDPGQTFCDKSGTPLPADRCNEANHIHVAF